MWIWNHLVNKKKNKRNLMNSFKKLNLLLILKLNCSLEGIQNLKKRYWIQILWGCKVKMVIMWIRILLILVMMSKICSLIMKKSKRKCLLKIYQLLRKRRKKEEITKWNLIWVLIVMKICSRIMISNLIWNPIEIYSENNIKIYIFLYMKY